MIFSIVFNGEYHWTLPIDVFQIEQLFGVIILNCLSLSFLSESIVSSF